MVILQDYNFMNHIHEYSLNHTFPNASAWKKIVKNILLRFESYTVDSHYLEIEGTLSYTSRYPYFDISDL